jgi:hypothetical protein
MSLTPEQTVLARPEVQLAVESAYLMGHEDGREEAEQDAGRIIEGIREMRQIEVLASIEAKHGGARGLIAQLRRLLRGVG